MSIERPPTSVHDTKPCPFCAELIKRAAMKCRFCGSFVDETARVAIAANSSLPEQAEPSNLPDKEKHSGWDACLQMLKGVQQLASAGLWLTILVAVVLLLWAC